MSTDPSATGALKKARGSNHSRVCKPEHILEKLALTYAISIDDARAFIAAVFEQMKLALIEGYSIRLPEIGTIHVVPSQGQPEDDDSTSRLHIWSLKVFLDVLNAGDSSKTESGVANLGQRMKRYPPIHSQVLARNVEYRELLDRLCAIWKRELTDRKVIDLNFIGRMSYGRTKPYWAQRIASTAQLSRALSISTDKELQLTLAHQTFGGFGRKPKLAAERRGIVAHLTEARSMAPSLTPPTEPITTPARPARGSSNDKSPHRRITKQG